MMSNMVRTMPSWCPCDWAQTVAARRASSGSSSAREPGHGRSIHDAPGIRAANLVRAELTGRRARFFCVTNASNGLLPTWVVCVASVVFSVSLIVGAASAPDRSATTVLACRGVGHANTRTEGASRACVLWTNSAEAAGVQATLLDAGALTVTGVRAGGRTWNVAAARRNPCAARRSRRGVLPDVPKSVITRSGTATASVRTTARGWARALSRSLSRRLSRFAGPRAPAAGRR